MKVAALQMVSSIEAASNLASALDLIDRAAAMGCELVVLPEYFCLLGARDTDKLAIAEREGQGPLQEAMAHAAQRHGVWLVAGTLPIVSDIPEKVFNSSLVFDPLGRQVARYDKIHLFAFDNGREKYDESRVLIPGTQPVAFELPSRDGHTWRVGLSICYDLRFAELYRALRADLLLVPSAFTQTTGQAHWEVLLRARAIENQAAVLAAAQGGHHDNGRTTWGQSLVIDAWGAILAEQATGAGVVCAELDWLAQQERRLQLPALQHHALSR